MIRDNLYETPRICMAGFVFTWVLAGIFAGCSYEALSDFQAEKGEVLRFRRMVGEGSWGQVYDNASPELKAAISRQEFVEGLAGVADQIRDYERFELASSTQSFRIAGSPLSILVYKNKSGPIVSDEFVFIRKEGTYQLYNYRYDFR